MKTFFFRQTSELDFTKRGITFALPSRKQNDLNRREVQVDYLAFASVCILMGINYRKRIQGKAYQQCTVALTT